MTDWFDLKIDEQRRAYGSEIKALRKSLEEQSKSLNRIYNIIHFELRTEDEQSFHHILNQFGDQLAEIEKLAAKHLGGSI